MKQCAKCSIWKDVSLFGNQKASPDGLRIWCKQCDNEHAKQYYQKHRQERMAYGKKWHKETYDESASAKQSARNRKQRELNPDYYKEYRKQNPDKKKASDTKRRAQKFGTNDEHYTPQQWSNLKRKYSYTCLCCRRREPEIKLTADHIVPLSKGGSNSIKNIQPLCVSCNATKGQKTIDYR